MSEKVDALRVVQEPKYAASLTDEQWRELALDPAWNEMVGEYYEMTEPVTTLYAAKLGVPEPQVVRTAATSPASPAAAAKAGFVPCATSIRASSRESASPRERRSWFPPCWSRPTRSAAWKARC